MDSPSLAMGAIVQVMASLPLALLLVVFLASSGNVQACNPNDDDLLYADPKDCRHTAMLRIHTKYPWDESKIPAYRREIEKGLVELEVYGGVTVPQMGTRTSKMAIRFEEKGRSVYGEQHTLSRLKVPCKTLQEFTRKAVSWSNNINKAALACRCEKPYEVYKINPIY